MKYVSGIFFVAFAVGITLLAYSGMQKSAIPIGDSSTTGRLEKLVPAEIASMTSENKPLGNTEEVVRASEKILNVTDFLNREYTTADGVKFTLYISYWAENKTRVVLAATHTPDRCWVKNGWKSLPDCAKSDVVVSTGGRSLMPAYLRRYEIKTDAQTIERDVAFWFIVDGKSYDYGSENLYVPNPITWLKSTLFASSPEMYFVRIDSSEDISKILGRADVKALLEKLGDLTLFERPKK